MRQASTVGNRRNILAKMVCILIIALELQPGYLPAEHLNIGIQQLAVFDIIIHGAKLAKKLHSPKRPLTKRQPARARPHRKPLHGLPPRQRLPPQPLRPAILRGPPRQRNCLLRPEQGGRRRIISFSCSGMRRSVPATFAARSPITAKLRHSIWNVGAYFSPINLNLSASREECQTCLHFRGAASNSRKAGI